MSKVVQCLLSVFERGCVVGCAVVRLRGFCARVSESEVKPIIISTALVGFIARHFIRRYVVVPEYCL